MRPLCLSAIVVITFCSLPLTASARFLPQASSSRPSYRALQVKARKDMRIKIPTLPATPLRAYRDELDGWRVEYPEDWHLTYEDKEAGTSRQRYEWTRFESSAFLGTTLSVGIATLGKRVTMDYLRQDAANYTRAPFYAEEFLGGRFLLMPEVLSNEISSWQKQRMLVTTFTHRCQSSTCKVRQIRIPTGNRIIVLEYSAIADRFDRNLHYFDAFTKSFALLK